MTTTPAMRAPGALGEPAQKARAAGAVSLWAGTLHGSRGRQEVNREGHCVDLAPGTLTTTGRSTSATGWIPNERISFLRLAHESTARGITVRGQEPKQR